MVEVYEGENNQIWYVLPRLGSLMLSVLEASNISGFIGMVGPRAGLAYLCFCME